MPTHEFPSILTAAGVKQIVDLSSVGTNLQDQALNLVFNVIDSAIPPAEFTPGNEPGTPAVNFADLEQVLGEEGAKISGAELVGSIEQRAKDLVASGVFTSVGGLKKALGVQAEAITKLRGMCYFLGAWWGLMVDG